MQRRSRRLAFLSAFVASATLAVDLPPAPDGYSWKQIDAIKAALLMPNGWHFKASVNHGKELDYVLSEEDFSTKDIDNDELGTGMMLGVSRLEDGKAMERPAAMIAMLTQAEGSELLDSWKTETGVLKGVGARVRRTEKGHPPLMMVALAIGNDKTGALYFFVFESPESRWDQAWEKGQKMLDRRLLDDEY